MSATRRVDNEGYQRAATVARELREDVADQLHDLVVEREAMGSHGELIERVQHLGGVARQLQQARGRQEQAREMGLALAPSIEQEKEAWRLLRAAVMALGAACGAYATAMDFEDRRAVDPELRNGG